MPVERTNGQIAESELIADESLAAARRALLPIIGRVSPILIGLVGLLTE